VTGKKFLLVYTAYEVGTDEGPETAARKIQTPGNNRKERKQQEEKFLVPSRIRTTIAPLFRR